MGSPPPRGSADSWEPGTWNASCSMCGFKFKFNQLEKNWQGQYRCPRCNEPRPAQDFVHAINSKEMSIPVVQKMPETDNIICSLSDTSSIPGYALPGCMVPALTWLTEFPL